MEKSIERHQEIDLRRALPEDSLAVFDWRNDPHTRSMFKNSELIDYSAHSSWFSKALSDVDRMIYIAEMEGIKIGVVRFDKIGASWEVSINISPNHRGNGCGKTVLRLGIKKIALESKAFQIKADVKSSNFPSKKIFESCGFSFVETIDGYDHYELLIT
jgi:RimJ/RimL family protein N-acetyltransferase